MSQEDTTYQSALADLDNNQFAVDENNFNTPDMGDYYKNCLDETYLNMIKSYMQGNSADVNGNKNDSAAEDLKKVAFYVDAPPVQKLGYDESQSVYFIKADKPFIDGIAEDFGMFDGSDVYFDLNSINAGDGTALAHLQTGVQDGWKELGSSKDPVLFGVCFVGANAPAIPHYSLERLRLNEFSIKDVTVADAKKSPNDYIYPKFAFDDQVPLRFINVGDGIWRSFTIYHDADADGYSQIKMCLSDSSTSAEQYQAGMKAQGLVKDMLSRPDAEIYLMLDGVMLSRNSSQYPTKFGGNPLKSSVINNLKCFADNVADYNEFTFSGFNQYGVDSYGRFQGTVYVKLPINGTPTWINLSKYVICNSPETIVNANTTDQPLYEDNYNYASNAFKLWTYDYKGRSYADAAWATSQLFDDRKKIQAQLFGRAFDDLKDWTVMIGDAMLFVPPTSIRCLTETTAERIPVMRAKGSLAKSSPKSMRTLEMKLFFNDDRGINGYPYKTTLPSGEEITYYMNGLRALIAQFKFTPFLPIENTYINEVLNIEAVTLMDMQISTMPDYPKTVAATITLQEFNYRIYMPEIPVQSSSDSEYRNYFSTVFNFETMRYYYQRPIIKGETLAQIAYSSAKGFNDPEYNKQTIGNQTALLPMQFQKPQIKFYIANEEYLKKMLQTKLESLKQPDSTVKMTDTDKQAASDVTKVYSTLANMQQDAQFANLLSAINGDGENEFVATSGTYPITEITPGPLTETEAYRTYYKDGEWRQEDTAETYRQSLNNVLAYMKNEFLALNDGNDFMLNDFRNVYLETNTGDQRTITIGIDFAVTFNYVSNDTQIQALRRLASKYVQKDIGNVFSGQRIRIPLTITLDSTGKSGTTKVGTSFALDNESDGVKFAGFCKDYTGSQDDGNTATQTIKEGINTTALNNLTFDLFDIGEVRVANLSARLRNTFAQISVNGTDGYAPQFMGGQDSVIELNIMTTDQKAVAMLNTLPRLSAQYVRDYRMVLPAWPLKLESEISGLLGVNEVLIENVDVSTVDKVPGLYSVTMHLTSVDRTLRSREALKRVGQSRPGYQGTSQQNNIMNNSFWDIDNILGKTELYPDLELPTIDELSQKNMHFIRYKLDDHRTYPDPDFYMVYGHILTSEILRESIINGLQGDNKYTLKDSAGGQLEISPTAGNGIKASNPNETATQHKKIANAAAKFKSNAQKEKPKADLEKDKKNMTDLLKNNGVFDGWNVCDDIRAIFLEKKYLMELQAYANSQQAIKTTTTTKTTTTDPKPEGQWVYNALEKARSASTLIDAYLKKGITTAPGTIDQNGIVNKFNTLYASDEVKAIFEALNINCSSTLEGILGDVIYACACAATGKKEYTGKSSGDWKPDDKFIGLAMGTSQDSAGLASTGKIDEAVQKGVEFGAFRIKLYKREDLVKMIGTEIDDKNLDANATDVNLRYYTIDPYYRFADKATIEAYKKGCITDAGYCTEAFFRNVLYWLKWLIDSNVLPTITMDVLRSSAKTEAFIQDVTKSKLGSNPDPIYANIKDFLGKSEPMDAGKIYTAAILAITGNDPKINSLIVNRDYKSLNGMIQSCASVPQIAPTDKAALAIRKMTLALVGKNRIKNFGLIGTAPTYPAALFENESMERKYIAAAEDPKMYIMHSFHDMVVNDARGRMLRAFPTFYLLFIDEGRQFGQWKLHDNFYSTNSISEIQVVKSRKIAADTAMISMSNMFHQYTTEDEDLTAQYDANWTGNKVDYGSVWDSIFNPRDLFMKQEAKRSTSDPDNKVRLRAGARIHIRMGYGSNAANLPIVFNGTITDVQAGEAVQLVAQGDGIELMNPILESDEAQEIKNKDNFFSFFNNLWQRGATPKEIITSLFTTKGGTMRKMVRWFTDGNFCNDNPYGIIHFGNPDYNAIFKNGEPVQNIYEATAKPTWGGEETGIASEYATDEVPRIAFEVFGKSVWDILHICTAVTPDFVFGVVPFGFRSTLFHGHPRYYFAYNYMGGLDSTVVEKRKPFQQYHIYTSATDIIGNNISASRREVKTCAVGMYSREETAGTKSQQKVGPMWVDFNIYPENQKTMIVDTQLTGKSVPILGSVTPFLNTLIDNLGSADGTFQSPYKIAWRMTASALKDKVKDMYQGELMILGDPAVKPHDRMMIHDTYENMSGQCLVKEVVQNFSADAGFTSSLFADCIAVVDDPHEMAIQTTLGTALRAATGAMYGLYAVYSMGGGAKTPLMRFVNWQGKSTLNGVAKTGQTLGKWGLEGAARTIANGVRATETAVAAAGEGATALLGGSMVAGAVLLAGELAVVAIAAGLVYEAIERWAKNLQVLTVFPLKRNGVVMTAGLEGSKGLVYGSPSYNDTGLIKGMFAKIAGPSETWIGGVLTDIFCSEEMQNIAWRYQRDYNVVNDEGTATGGEKATEGILKTVLGSQTANLASYKKHLLTPRAAETKEMATAVSKFAILDTLNVQIQPRILQENAVISWNEEIKSFMDKKFFKILHEQPELTADYSQAMTFDYNSEKVQVKAITVKDGSGNVSIYDLPFLKQEAISILAAILQKAYDKMPKSESSDPYEVKPNFIILESALRVGDSKTFSATGYSFVIRGVQECAGPLKAAVEELKTEIETIYNQNGGVTAKSMFVYQNVGDNIVSMTVLPPSPGTEEGTA